MIIDLQEYMQMNERGWFMQRTMKHIVIGFMLLAGATATHAGESSQTMLYTDLNLNIELLDSDVLLADNRALSNVTTVPNIPDSAFKKPIFTENDLHMYLGLASMALGGIAAISAPEGFDPDLLNTVHYKAGKLSWQLGAAAIGTGLWAHWDDFHLEDGLLDRDNLHVILGTLGVIGYYLAVKDAVDEYNVQNAAGVRTGYPSENHSSAGTFGGAAMLTAIVITW